MSKSKPPKYKTTGAEISHCKQYRYSLWRIWELTKPSAVFIGLNPSTADASHDDPTIKKCVKYAKRWQCGGLVMLNLYAFRATNPADMLAADDPIGPSNNDTLVRVIRQCIESGVVVASWGNHAAKERVDDFRSLIGKELSSRLSCLQQNKTGAPKHPLYCRDDQTLSAWTVDHAG